MRTIAVVAVLAILLIDVGNLIPKSSVGGPLALMHLHFLVMLAVGLHEAWSKRRGVLGWIVNIVAALVGGFVAIGLVGLVFEAILPHLNLNGALATSQHPVRYIASAAMMLFTILGSWAALQIANRFR